MTARLGVKIPGQEATAQLLYPAFASYQSNCSLSTRSLVICVLGGVRRPMGNMFKGRVALFTEWALCSLSDLGLRQMLY